MTTATPAGLIVPAGLHLWRRNAILSVLAVPPSTSPWRQSSLPCSDHRGGAPGPSRCSPRCPPMYPPVLDSGLVPLA
jgi:hypothetical protein